MSGWPSHNLKSWSCLSPGWEAFTCPRLTSEIAMSHVFRRLQRQVTHEPPRWSPPSCGGFQPSSIHGSFPPRTVASVASRHYSTRSRFNKADQRSLGTREIEGTFQQRQWKRSVHLQQSDKQRINQGSQQIKSVTNGRILTTPTRLLKLILWLPNENSKDRDTTSKKNASDRSTSVNEANQPLALLVHPQQPLSYIERLVQAEIPPILKDGKEITPSVRFRAVGDNTNASGKPETSDTDEQALSHPDDLSHVASYSGLGHEGPERDKADTNWVRWSNSTEIGDFIRDAARGTEFVIEIEGHDGEMRVSVPSFNDRTFYMRSRLRKMSRQIDELSHIKRECDLLAYRGANRLAKGGFALLTGWWCVVYYVTFHTEFGWDLVEPVTYLAGLTTIMGGYLWFLYISKDLSYKAAMNVTVSRRQNALYEARGFEPEKWEHLVQEANALRREIRAIAVEYDVDWDESMDVGDEVKEVLDQERNTKDGTLPAEKQKTEPGGAERRKKDEASDADES